MEDGLTRALQRAQRHPQLDSPGMAGWMRGDSGDGSLMPVLLAPFGLPLGRGAVLPARDGWPALIEAATVHGVLSALHRAPFAERIPDDAASEISAAYFTTLTRHFKTIRFLTELTTAFEGLRWAVVKGPVSAELDYPAADLRPYFDLDLLVHPADFGAALDALAARGGGTYERQWSVMRAQERGEVGVILPDDLRVDLHWHLVNDPAVRRRLNLSTAALLERSRPVELGGVTAPALHPVDAALHLCVHAVLSGAHKLRWNLDVLFGARRAAAESTASEIVARTNDTGCAAFVEVMSHRVHRLTGAALPAPFTPTRPPGLWLRGVTTIDNVTKPERWGGGPGSGRLLLGATRPGDGASLAALAQAGVTAVREFRANPQHQWRRRRGGEPVTNRPLLHDDPDPNGRSRFLAYVATQR